MAYRAIPPALPRQTGPSHLRKMTIYRPGVARGVRKISVQLPEITRLPRRATIHPLGRTPRPGGMRPRPPWASTGRAEGRRGSGGVGLAAALVAEARVSLRPQLVQQRSAAAGETVAVEGGLVEVAAAGHLGADGTDGGHAQGATLQVGQAAQPAADRVRSPHGRPQHLRCAG